MRRGVYEDRMLRVGKPIDWWRAAAWPARARVIKRIARHLKRVEANAEKTEVSPPPKKKIGRPAKSKG